MLTSPKDRDLEGNAFFVPNTNNQNDKGFNEITIAGIENYEDNFGRGVDIIPPDVSSPTNDQFKVLYEIGIDSGKTVAIGNSFTQYSALTGYCTGYDGESAPEDESSCVEWHGKWEDGLVNNHEGIYFVLLDHAEFFSQTDTTVSFGFTSNQAGFLAGVAASIFAIYENKDEPYVSTWGGMALDTVYDWMSGFEQGINWFNYAILGYDLYGDEIINMPGGSIKTAMSLADITGLKKESYTFNLGPTVGIEPVRLIDGIKYGNMGGQTVFIDYDKEVPGNVSDWFDGNFVPGAVDITTTKQWTAGSLVMFPVSSPNVPDALNTIPANDGINQKVIGVDVDASLSVAPELQENILGSAIKDLEQAMELALWYTDRWVHHFDSNIEELIIDPEPGDIEMARRLSISTDHGGWNTKEGAWDGEGTLDNEMVSSSSYDPEAKGELSLGNYFEGTATNGASKFVEPGSNTNLSDAYSSLQQLLKIEDTLDEFFEASINAQWFIDHNGVLTTIIAIEAASTTFSGHNAQTTGCYYDDAPDECSQFPWIPDWEVYT